MVVNVHSESSSHEGSEAPAEKEQVIYKLIANGTMCVCKTGKFLFLEGEYLRIYEGNNIEDRDDYVLLESWDRSGNCLWTTSMAKAEFYSMLLRKGFDHGKEHAIQKISQLVNQD